MAGLRKLRGKFYARVFYYEHGQTKEKLIGLNTKQRAKAERLLPQIEQKERLLRDNVITIEEFTIEALPELQPMIDDFTDHLKRNNRSQKTIELYEYALDAFSDIMKNKNIHHLSKKDYPEFLDQMKLKYNTTTLNIRLRSIRAFLNWLAETERIKTTPWNIKQLPVQRKRPIYFTDAEMYKILEAAKDNRELYSRIYVHWKTGLRLREFENSYLENGFITTIDPCKNGIQRDIPADKETAKQYTWLKENSKHIPGTISKMFLELIKDLKLHETKAGDTRHFHCLRHTFAVKTYFQTRDIYRVSKLLGHSTVKTTEIYSCFELSKLEQDFNSETTAKPVLQKALEITLQEVIKAEARRIKPQAHPKPLPKPQTATEPILIPVLDEVYIQKYTA